MNVAFSIETGAYRDHIRMNIQNIRDHLRSRGFMTLALRTGPDRYHDFSVNIQFAVCPLRVAGIGQAWVDDLRLAKVVRARIQGRADADSHQAALFASCSLFSLPLLPADDILGELEHARIIS